MSFACPCFNWPVPSHYLNQCWSIVNWILGNNLQLNLNRNLYIFIQENAFENVVWKGGHFFGLNVLRGCNYKSIPEARYWFNLSRWLKAILIWREVATTFTVHTQSGLDILFQFHIFIWKVSFSKTSYQFYFVKSAFYILPCVSSNNENSLDCPVPSLK